MLAATHDHEVIHHNKTKGIPWRRVLDRRLKKPNISQMFALQWSLENLLAGTSKSIFKQTSNISNIRAGDL